MFKRKLFISLVSVLLIVTALITGCKQQAADDGGPVIDEGAAVEVWIDAAREESAGKFIDKYPDEGALVTLTTTDYGQLPQKILFWNNVGGGWPDASFAGPNIVPLINDVAHSYLGDMKPFLDQEIIDGFSPGALTNCWDAGKLYCVRNDLAFFVNWYNAPKVAELGVKIPETWEEAKDICTDVQKTNPEVQCMIGPEGVAWFNALASAKCPFQQIMGPGQLRINAVHDNCYKAATFIDDATQAGWYKLTNMWSSETSELIQSGNWLFLPSSSWFGDYVIKGTYFDPEDPNFQGMIGVAPAPKWQGDEHPWTWWWGGAAWVMSRHTENPQLTVDFLVYMTTDVIKEQGTYPAYKPAAEVWLAERMPTLTYLEDSAAAGEMLKQESSHMWTMAAESPVDVNGLWGPIQTMINSGDLNYESALAEFQTALLDGAGKLGYEAVTTGMDDFPTE